MSGETILFGLMIWCLGSVPLALFIGNIIGLGAEPTRPLRGRNDLRRAGAHVYCAPEEQPRTGTS